VIQGQKKGIQGRKKEVRLKKSDPRSKKTCPIIYIYKSYIYIYINHIYIYKSYIYIKGGVFIAMLKNHRSFLIPNSSGLKPDIVMVELLGSLVSFPLVRQWCCCCRVARCSWSWKWSWPQGCSKPSWPQWGQVVILPLHFPSFSSWYLGGWEQPCQVDQLRCVLGDLQKDRNYPGNGFETWRSCFGL